MEFQRAKPKGTPEGKCLFFYSSSQVDNYSETRDIWSNISLCLKEFQRAKPKGTLEGKGLNLTFSITKKDNIEI